MAKKNDLRSQSARFLKGFLALGDERKSSKRKDNTSAGIHSIRTYREYVSSLSNAAKSLGVARVKHITYEMAVGYLIARSNAGLKNKSLSRDRAALERLTGRALPNTQNIFDLSTSKQSSYTTKSGHILNIKEALKVAKRLDNTIVNNHKRAGKPLSKISRAYTLDQFNAITERASDKAKLSLLITLDSGLRAHELITLRKPSEGKILSEARNWSNERFIGKEGVRYIVSGKGGLVREVMISKILSDKLESCRRGEPITVKDRGVNYTSYYDVISGQSLSQTFTDLSKETLNFSLGIHGLRHTYAQNRYCKITGRLTEENDLSKRIVSQELGHMRSSITDVYLR